VYRNVLAPQSMHSLKFHNKVQLYTPEHLCNIAKSSMNAKRNGRKLQQIMSHTHQTSLPTSDCESPYQNFPGRSGRVIETASPQWSSPHKKNNGGNAHHGIQINVYAREIILFYQSGSVLLLQIFLIRASVGAEGNQGAAPKASARPASR
jgi:hypothetical protein